MNYKLLKLLCLLKLLKLVPSGGIVENKTTENNMNFQLIIRILW